MSPEAVKSSRNVDQALLPSSQPFPKYFAASIHAQSISPRAFPVGFQKSCFVSQLLSSPGHQQKTWSSNQPKTKLHHSRLRFFFISTKKVIHSQHLPLDVSANPVPFPPAKKNNIYPSFTPFQRWCTRTPSRSYFSISSTSSWRYSFHCRERSWMHIFTAVEASPLSTSINVANTLFKLGEEKKKRHVSNHRKKKKTSSSFMIHWNYSTLQVQPNQPPKKIRRCFSFSHRMSSMIFHQLTDSGSTVTPGAPEVWRHPGRLQKSCYSWWEFKH